MSNVSVVTGKEMDRAAYVSNQLVSLKNETRKNFFVMVDLLLEAYEQNYHVHYGCANFKTWIEQSDFDISGRSAYYLVSIGKRVNELGLSREAMQEIPISKLKEILSLEPATHAEDIKQLLGASEDMTVDEVKEKVKSFKNQKGEEIYTHLNLRIPSTVKESIEEAFELARRLHGSTIDQYGEIADISDSKCLEYIVASFLQDPNNYEQDNAERTKSFDQELIVDEVTIQ